MTAASARRTLATFFTTLLAGTALVLAGCGGGGGDNNNAAPAAPSPTPAANQVAVTVGPNVFRNPNSLVTSVTICVPGTGTCQTIDNVLVDTGSFGLRLMASAVSIALPQVSANGGIAAECVAFASGTTWGAVRQADIKLAGEVAATASVQIIGDSTVPNAPSSCLGQGVQDINTADLLGSNGILGVGLQSADCPACANTALSGVYYNCTSASQCQPSTLPVVLQVTNPVSLFASDNNGVVIQMPAVPVLGQSSTSGTMTFGIGTQANNGLGSSKIYTVSPTRGTLTTQYNGVTVADAFIDSGSNGLFFDDSGITQCADAPGLYCPPSTLSRTATIQGLNGATASIPFSVGNVDQMLATGAYAMAGFAGTGAGVFDWGLPFFFGRTVYTAINGRATPGGNGPYFAF